MIGIYRDKSIYVFTLMPPVFITTKEDITKNKHRAADFSAENTYKQVLCGQNHNITKVFENNSDLP